MAENIRGLVLQMMEKKQKIEAELDSYYDILRQNNIGISESLIDGEGYPINTVDIPAVRTARNRIICLRNDHKNIMLEIEKGLAGYYAVKTNDSELISECLEPIAQVNMVMKDSPAEIDGIKLNDLIVQFGALNQKNFKALTDFAEIMRNSENKSLLVKVRRNSELKTILLTPRRWTGKGLLGCNILPIESIER